MDFIHLETDFERGHSRPMTTRYMSKSKDDWFHKLEMRIDTTWVDNNDYRT